MEEKSLRHFKKNSNRMKKGNFPREQSLVGGHGYFLGRTGDADFFILAV